MTDTPISVDNSSQHLQSIARGKALKSAVSFIKTSDIHHVDTVGTVSFGRCDPVHQTIGLHTFVTPVKTMPPHCNHEDLNAGVIDIPKIDCICNRSLKTVLCRSCGQMFNGRVRRKCLLHPNSIHLMDMVCCPNCKASQIKEFTDMDSERKRNI